MSRASMGPSMTDDGAEVALGGAGTEREGARSDKTPVGVLPLERPGKHVDRFRAHGGAQPPRVGPESEGVAPCESREDVLVVSD